MRLKMNKRIFIIDDDEYSLESIKYCLDFNKYQINLFKYSEDLLSHKLLKEADLFVIDVRLDNESGIELSLKLQNMGIHVPRFYVSGFAPEEFFDQLTKYNHRYMYDFVSKPFNSLTFLNRINVLLKLSTYQKYLKEEKDKAESTMWNMLINNSNFFIISIDTNLKIKTCSTNLVKILKYKANSIIGENWTKFIDSDFKRFIDDFKKRKDKSKYCEITGNIINDKKIKIPVKWFVSLLMSNEIFCIGTILKQDIYKNNNIESIREYFKNILIRDDQMLKEIKQSKLIYKEKENLCQT